MAETERRIAELAAQTVIARLLDIARDPKVAEEIIDVWAGQLDQTIGRGIRRAVWYLIIILLGVLGHKLGILTKLGELFKP